MSSRRRGLGAVVNSHRRQTTQSEVVDTERDDVLWFDVDCPASDGAATALAC